MSFDEMMADLKKEYLASFPQKIKHIQEHLSANQTELLRDDFHKLKGTGKTYGMPEVTSLGEVVEAICKKTPDKAIDAIPHALNILSRIHEAHSKQSSLNIHEDPDFKKLLTI